MPDIALDKKISKEFDASEEVCVRVRASVCVKHM